jgi:hypoxanthine phosphoribosyltransferase
MMHVKSFDEVWVRFREIEISESFDMIVAIAQGGIIPAAILNQRLNIDFHIIHINLRDPAHRPQHDKPILLSPIDFNCTGKKILLIDDRIKTGSTIVLAKEVLKDAAEIKTFAVNGEADYALYNEACFRFPWLL